MTKEKPKKCSVKDYLEMVNVFFQILFFILSPLLFYKCSKDIKLLRRETTLNEIIKIKNREFLESLTRLKVVSKASDLDSLGCCDVITQLYDHKREDCYKAKISFWSDLNYTFNIYDNLATYQKSEVMEDNILAESICSGVRQFDTILADIENIHHYSEGYSFPKENLNNLKNFCETKTK